MLTEPLPSNLSNGLPLLLHYSSFQAVLTNPLHTARRFLAVPFTLKKGTVRSLETNYVISHP
jgi:hypothetical protein